MKVLSSQSPVLILAVFAAMSALAQEAATTPVEFPKLEAYAALWERSVFTTKDLPSPDAPAGPSFVDNLTLLGLYEFGGEVVASISDKTTSQVFQAKIGSENEIGVKIRKIQGEVTDAKVRVQLQKGDQVGWITVSDGINAMPAETIAPAGLPAQAAPPGIPTRQTAASLLLPNPSSIPQVPTITPEPESTPPLNRRIMPAAPAPMHAQAPPAGIPPAPVAVPAAQQVDGIPLPPP
jgi:hypothetical protein